MLPKLTAWVWFLGPLKLAWASTLHNCQCLIACVMPTGASEAGMGSDHPQVPGADPGPGQGEPEGGVCRGAGLCGPQPSAITGGPPDPGLLPQLCQGQAHTHAGMHAHTLSCSLTHALNHALNHSLTPSLTPSLTRSLTHPLTHSLTHSLARTHPPTHAWQSRHHEHHSSTFDRTG